MTKSLQGRALENKEVQGMLYHHNQAASVTRIAMETG